MKDNSVNQENIDNLCSRFGHKWSLTDRSGTKVCWRCGELVNEKKEINQK